MSAPRGTGRTALGLVAWAGLWCGVATAQSPPPVSQSYPPVSGAAASSGWRAASSPYSPPGSNSQTLPASYAAPTPYGPPASYPPPTSGMPALNAPGADAPPPAAPLSSSPLSPTVAADRNELLSPPEETVVEVRILGNKTVSTARVLSEIRTRQGRPFRRDVIEQDVQRLDDTNLFADIKTSSQQAPGGRIVIFEVVERPTLRYVKFIGNQAIKKKTLLKESGLKTGGAANPFAVQEAQRKIEQYYRDHGFPESRVTIHEGAKPGDQGVVFVIREGPKQRVAWTDFVGNTIADDTKLRTHIESKQGIFWVFKGEFDRRKVEEDKGRIIAYYRSLGYFNASVDVEVRYVKEVSLGEWILAQDRKWVRVTFVINEGPRYKIRDIYFGGNRVFNVDQLGGELKLVRGDFFNQMKMETDVREMKDKYGQIGYVKADVVAEPRLLEEPGTLDLVYSVREGHRYQVGRVEPVINEEYPHTKLATVLNQVSQRPGDIMNTAEIRNTERRLGYSGLFETNPAAGMSPKVVMVEPGKENRSPEREESPQLAQPPSLTRFRGQSPDPSPPRPVWSPTRPAPTPWSGTRDGEYR